MIPGAGPVAPSLRTRVICGVVLLSLVLLAVLFRSYWYVATELEPAFTHHGHPILTSTDGYYFAAGVGAATSDAWGELARVPDTRHGLVAIGAGLVEVFGVEPEAVFTWLAPLIGALIVIPLFALGWLAGGPWVATLAGLGAAVAPSHVGRTTVGYFDTDMFAVSIPLAATALMVSALMRKGQSRPPWAIGGAAVLLASYPFFYDQGHPLALVLVVGFAVTPLVSKWLGHGLVLPWFPRALVILTLAVLPLAPLWNTVLVVAAMGVLRVLGPLPRERWVAAIVLGAVVLTSPATMSLFKKVAIYTNESASDPEESQVPDVWVERDTTESVAEARVLPLAVMATKAAGHPILFVFGIIGLVLLFLARPSMVLLGPILAVGLFAFFGGHRFLVYLSPLLPLGLAWLTVRLITAVPFLRPRAWVSLAAAPMFLPALLTTVPHAPRPVFVKGEVEQLEALGALAKRVDTTIAWWDYGYPVAYYARTRTIADGSRRADDASIVAEILLTSSDDRARRLALLSAGAEARSSDGASRLTIEAARAQGLSPETWLAQVEAGTWNMGDLTPQGDVYLYLPLRMMPVIPTLAHYRPGAPGEAVQLVRYPQVKVNGKTLTLRDGLEVDGNKAIMRRRDRRGHWETKTLSRIYSVSGTGTQRVIRAREGDPNARTAGVFLADLALFVALDTSLLDTVWARLFLFEEPSGVFALVSSTPGGKVYRVRPY